MNIDTVDKEEFKKIFESFKNKENKQTGCAPGQHDFVPNHNEYSSFTIYCRKCGQFR